MLTLEARVPLSIKNRRVERLAEEVAETTGESKTEAIRKALEERRQRLAARVLPSRRRMRVMRMLEREVWAAIPQRLLGRPRDHAFEDRVLGYDDTAS